MTVRVLNALKATRRCLKCGDPMWTDRCHRICTRCSHANEGMGQPPEALTRELVIRFERGLSLEEQAS